MRTSLDHWQALWNRFAIQGDAEAWHVKLTAAYQEPQRAYHTLQHLNECLLAFDEAKAEACGLMLKPDLIEMALWFHDAMYDPQASDNEALSAQMAVEALGDSEASYEINRLIMLTKSHHPGEGPDDAWIIDIDLTIFAQSPERVQEYEQQIRQEYAWVPKAVYREKRPEILTSFLNRPHIYLTPWAQDRYEAKARENLRMLIESVKSGCV